MRFDNQTGRFRNVAAASTQSASPRICMPTWRNFTKSAFRCGFYEAQDILVESDDVDLVHLDMTWGAWFEGDLAEKASLSRHVKETDIRESRAQKGTTSLRITTYS